MNAFRIWSVALIAVLISGCGGSGRLPTVPVSGTVKVGGKPIQGAVVAFFPDAENNSRPAIGTTGEDGSFTLTTYDDGDGAVAGSYSITISKAELKEDVDQRAFAPTNDPNDKEGAKAYAKMMMAIQGGYSPLKKEAGIPAKFADKATSGLKRSVEESGGNIFNFDLKTGG